MFGDLGGDFCKDTYEAKLFGMYIGSVLSGLDAGNVNTDTKMSIVGPAAQPSFFFPNLV